MALTGDLVTGQPVSFKRLRQMLLDQGGGVQEGVVNAGDFKVTQRGAGANMSVDVAAGFAWVQIDTGSFNGLSHIASDAVDNRPIPASHATLPRIDSVFLQYNDSAISAGVGGNVPTLRVVQGTATSGATLDNRTGAPGGAGGPAFPADALLLGDVLVPAASGSVVNANIRDRRKWARGAFSRILRTANAAAGNDYTTTSTTQIAVDSANLSPRIECSGAPLRVKLTGRQQGSAGTVQGFFLLDGALLDGNASVYNELTGDHVFGWEWVTVPTAASHVIAPAYAASAGGTALLFARSGLPLLFTVEELVRQNSTN